MKGNEPKRVQDPFKGKGNTTDNSQISKYQSVNNNDSKSLNQNLSGDNKQNSFPKNPNNNVYNQNTSNSHPTINFELLNSPKNFVRPTINKIPVTNKLLRDSYVPFGLTISPLTYLEEPVILK